MTKKLFLRYNKSSQKWPEAEFLVRLETSWVRARTYQETTSFPAWLKVRPQISTLIKILVKFLSTLCCNVKKSLTNDKNLLPMSQRLLLPLNFLLVLVITLNCLWTCAHSHWFQKSTPRTTGGPSRLAQVVRQSLCISIFCALRSTKMFEVVSWLEKFGNHCVRGIKRNYPEVTLMSTFKKSFYLFLVIIAFSIRNVCD